MTPEQVVARYQAAYGRLRADTVRRVQAAWDLYGALDDVSAARLVSVVVPIVEGAQTATGSLVAAYLAILSRLTVGESDVVAPAVGDLSDEAIRGVAAAEIYRRPVVAARTAISEGKTFVEAVAAGRDRLEQIADTDVALAQRQATLQIVSASDRMTGYRRVLTGRSCAYCATASTQRYHKAQLAPIHARCVPSGSVVAVPTGVSNSLFAVTRRRYAGELVSVRTAAGDFFSVTPNHPVLTHQGWIPAHRLCEGDDVFRGSFAEWKHRGRPYEHQRPAFIEYVWSAVAMQGRLVRMPLAPEDFHGDGSDGYVDVVWTDGNLSPVGDVKPAYEGGFMFGQWAGSTGPPSRLPTLLIERNLSAAHRGMSGGGLSEALIRRHLGGSGQSRLAAVTRFDPPGEKFSFESAAVYAERGMDLIGRLATEIEADRVIKLERIGFRGHVYDLFTAEGWFTVGNHIVSNCDCGVAPIFGEADPGQVINRRLLKDLKSAAKAGGKGDYWRSRHFTVAEDGSIEFPSIKVHHHGELGPVLTHADHAFAGPSVAA